MKSVRQIIKDMVDKYPNDMELGQEYGTSDGYMIIKKIKKITMMINKSGVYDEKTINDHRG